MKPLRRLGFLTIGLFDEHNPAQGHESTLAIIELGERLGFDSAWVRRSAGRTRWGPGWLLFSRDYVGTSEELAAQPAFREIDEVAFALPSWARHSAGGPLRTPGARATPSASPGAHRPAPA